MMKTIKVSRSATIAQRADFNIAISIVYFRSACIWRWSSPETPDGPINSCKVKPLWEMQMARHVTRGGLFDNHEPEPIQVKQ